MSTWIDGPTGGGRERHHGLGRAPSPEEIRRQEAIAKALVGAFTLMEKGTERFKSFFGRATGQDKGH